MLERFEELKQEFIAPPIEFSPMPFWFWNDELSKSELIRQIHDFHSKEVHGFVLHPRMGIPRTMPYLSESYMELVEAAVSEADKLGMKVILYDEGMYPSGSACGMVVAHNPDYASRGLQLQEYPCHEAGSTMTIPIKLAPGEAIVSAQAVQKLSDREIEPASITILRIGEDSVDFTVPHAGNWAVLLFIDTASKGTIRGVHSGQDDGEPDAPLAADLLNPNAVQAFISLTHDRYYQRLDRYFGTSIIAMFTDEPDLLGRRHIKGLKPWTVGFMSEFVTGGGKEEDLPVLWFEAGEATRRIRETFESAVRNRLSRTYYKQLADWCEGHRIGLTGHPADSNDIGLLAHFHIPGQDVVWRSVAPEEDKSLTGVNSTMGKCSSDSARHRGKRRNLNECFGVCGIEGGWSLTADNMKWYLDWLFIRGVNLINPHAFYYSIRDERKDERPPDVGPHNIWWSEYAQFARYIKRMSWLMTDSINGAEVAVLTGSASLPWRIVKPLYEQQIEFNYLEQTLLCSTCQVKDRELEIAGYRYKAILIEEDEWLSQESWQALEKYADQGGLIIQVTQDRSKTKNIGQLYVDHQDRIPEVLTSSIGRDCRLEPASDAIRISRVTKDGGQYYVVANEGEEAYAGTLRINHSGLAECWRPWTGECKSAIGEQTVEGQLLNVIIDRRECLVFAIDPSTELPNADSIAKRGEPVLLEDLSVGWRVLYKPIDEELEVLTSWTDWSGMKTFSGTVIYERQFELADPAKWASIELDLGVVHELARLWVNDQEAGVRMWAPYRFDIMQLLQSGHNVLRVSVTNSLANRYDGKSLPSGLIGPIWLLGRQTKLSRELIESGIDKTWTKLSGKPKDIGDRLDGWEWVQGVGMYGVIKAFESTKQERFGSFLRKWADENVDKIRFGSVNWVVPANVLLSVHQETGDLGLLENCREVADWCMNRALLTTNGGFAHVWGPGAGGLEDYKNQLWIDTLFMAGIFMLRFGIFDQNRICVEKALDQFDIHINCQFDSTCDLFFHGYHCLDQASLGQHWGRGNGWAAVSLIELLDLLRDQPYPTDKYNDLFRRLMESVYRLRMKDGMLRTLLDEEESYLETSASVLFAYAALKGHRLGLLDDKFGIWGEQVTREMIIHHLDQDGTVLHASGGTDCQGREGYLEVPYRSMQYTTGIALMLFAEALQRKEG